MSNLLMYNFHYIGTLGTKYDLYSNEKLNWQNRKKNYEKKECITFFLLNEGSDPPCSLTLHVRQLISISIDQA